MAEGFTVRLVPSRALCGLHPREFGEVLARLAPLVEGLRQQRLARPGRKRAPGAGVRPKPFGFRLLVALSYLRLGTSLRETGAVFAVDEKSVRNYRDEIQELLARHGVLLPGRAAPVRDVGELAGYLIEMAGHPESYVIIDGTETRRGRPGGWAAQRPAYSAKSHQHAVKATVITDPQGRPMWFEANPSGHGRTHDIAMLGDQDLLGALAASKIPVLGDLGYLGLDKLLPDSDVYFPRRRRKGARRLNRDDNGYNHALAQARIRVEHGIGHLKTWGGLRRWRRHPDQLDTTGKAVTTLLSLRRA